MAAVAGVKSLEWLKGCGTNVQIIEDVFKSLHYSVWTRESLTSPRSVFHTVVYALRKKGVFCEIVDEEVVVFSSTKEQEGEGVESKEMEILYEETKAQLGVDLKVDKRGNVKEDATKTILGDGQRTLKSILLSAIEGQISFTLSKTGRVVRVGEWTWLYHNHSTVDEEEEVENEEGGIILKLHPNLTTDGKFHISTTTHSTSLAPATRHMSTLPSSCSLTLAPSGKKAKLAGRDTDLGIQTQTPKLNSEAWRKDVTSALSVEGIDVSEETEKEKEWINVDVDVAGNGGERKLVVWPTRMCLVDHSHEQSEKFTEWRRWFGSNSADAMNDGEEGGYKDPVAEAEELFLSASAHATATSLTTITAAAAAETGEQTTTVNASEGMQIASESPLVTSPPFNQRLLDQQNAAMGIYPTPPDGLLGGHGMVTPTPNITSDMPSADALHTDPSANLLGSDDVQQDDPSRGQSFSAEPQGYDLFGDVGLLGDTDEFGGNEVGDADFDYFDEPDDLSGAIPETTDMEITAQAEAEEEDTELVDAEVEGEGEVVNEGVVDDNVEAIGGAIETSGLLQADATADPTGELHIIDSNDVSPAAKESAHLNEEAPAPHLDTTHLDTRREDGVLPTPISAHPPERQHLRRKSTFDPMAFDNGIDLSAKYASYSTAYNELSSWKAKAYPPNIGLPRKRKQAHARDSNTERFDSGVDNMDDAASSLSSSAEEEDDQDAEDGSGSSMDEDVGGHEVGEDVKSLATTVSKLPWATTTDTTRSRERKRRKQNSIRWDVALPPPPPDMQGYEDTAAILSHLLHTSSSSSLPAMDSVKSTNDNSDEERGAEVLRPIEVVHDNLEPLDLVHIAQLVAEQVTTCTNALAGSIQSVSNDIELTSSYTRKAETAEKMATQALVHALPSSKNCGLDKIVLIKEPVSASSAASAAQRTPSSTASAFSGRSSHPSLQNKPQLHSQPRQPPHRSVGSSGGEAGSSTNSASALFGPDCFAILPPYIHVNRSNNEAWELLPPALTFWTELGLAPGTGAKDLGVLSVVPDNKELGGRVGEWMGEFKRVWEGCKMGGLGLVSSLGVEDVDVDGGEDGDGHGEEAMDGVVLVKGSQAGTIEEVFRAYATECEGLGKRLATIAADDPTKTIVVCFINVFGDHPRVYQHLCACFRILFNAYRDNTRLLYESGEGEINDLVLQILPVELIASPDNGPVILSSSHLQAVAMELYARVPAQTPSSSRSPLGPGSAHPPFHLAPLLPKRITFSSSSTAPADLLHEGSILHLAYALSRDQEWLSVYWVDSTAEYQQRWTVCLRGRGFGSAVERVWAETLGVLTGRDVGWRVFIVACGGGDTGGDRRMQWLKDDSEQKIWRDTVARMPRRQVLHVSLLSVEIDTHLQLSPPAPEIAKEKGKATSANETTPSGAGTITTLLTPGSTPQSSNHANPNITVSVSPGDATASATANSAQKTAAATPPTNITAANLKADTPTVASVLEADPSARLLDSSDESWGLLLSSAFSSLSLSSKSSHSNDHDAANISRPLASGLLLRRGSPNPTHLSSLGVELWHDLRIRPNGVVDEGGQRQGEQTLREVLRMFRALGVVASADAMGKGSQVGSLPVHVECAVRGVGGFEGFLKAV